MIQRMNKNKMNNKIIYNKIKIQINKTLNYNKMTRKIKTISKLIKIIRIIKTTSKVIKIKMICNNKHKALSKISTTYNRTNNLKDKTIKIYKIKISLQFLIINRNNKHHISHPNQRKLIIKIKIRIKSTINKASSNNINPHRKTKMQLKVTKIIPKTSKTKLSKIY